MATLNQLAGRAIHLASDEIPWAFRACPGGKAGRSRASAQADDLDSAPEGETEKFQFITKRK